MEYQKQNLKDITLACYSYILEKIGFNKALNVLIEVLGELIKKNDIVFSQHFFTHTIKVMTNQPELDLVNFSYPNAEIEKTIEKSRRSD